MRKIFSLIILALAVSSCSKNYFDQYSAQKINDTLYVIHGPTEYPNPDNRGFMNNPAFILSEDGVVVVDPGSSHETGSMLLREIKKITDKPVTHIFNTHVHGDHWLGNDIILQSYPDAIVMADPRMIKKAKAGAAQTWIDNLISLTDGATKGTKIAYPDTVIQDGEELKISNLTFKFHVVGIAHSDTDVMIEYVEGSTLFTGDNAGHKRVMRIDDGNFRDSIKAMEKAISLNLKHYVPGHGPTGDIKVAKLQHEYFNLIYTQVETFNDEGLEDFEMKEKIEPKLTKFKDWSGFQDELGKHISLAKLEIEQAEFE